MSAPQLRAALHIWRARTQPTGGDKAYAFYAFVLVVIVVITPVVRLLWTLATSPSGIALLTSPTVSVAVSLITAGLWAGALLVGRRLGPALRPRFLLHALTESGIRRAVALRGPLIRAGAIIVASLAGSAVFVGVVLVAVGRTHVFGAVGFVAAAVAAGVIATGAWLTGQALPRAATLLALGIIAFGALRVLSPQVLAFVPWGWVGASYPLSGASAVPLAGISVFALLLATASPGLLRMLTGVQLGDQAARWERATTFSRTLEFSAAAGVYEAPPRFGRHIRAVRARRQHALTFFVRDLVGQLRTPVRFFAVIGVTAAAGMMLTLASSPGTPNLSLAGVAGLVAYAASGPLAKGLRHAAAVAGDYPLYGISDGALVRRHALFPLATLMLVLSTAAVSIAFLTGSAVNIALVGAWAVAFLTPAVRLSSALKGSLPPSLLVPVPTPAGDLSVLVQLGWAGGEPFIAVLSGITVALLSSTPIPLMLLCASVAVLLASRWRKRR